MKSSPEAPHAFANLLDVLGFQSNALADKLAYDYLGQERLTYREVHDESRRRARGLVCAGLKPHEACAILLPLSTEQVLLVYAVQWTGAAPVLLDPEAPPVLLCRRIEQSRASRVICTPQLRKALGKSGLPEDRCITPTEIESRSETEGPALPEITPEHTAFLQFTSGTTGEPKAVVIQQRQLMAYLESHARMQRVPEPEVFLSWLPLFHDMGLVGTVYLSLYIGGECHLLPPHIFSLGQWLQTASRVKATVTSGPDFAYRMVTRTVNPSELDLSSLRMTGSGGEPLRIETIRKFEERFGLRHTSIGGYGQAEAVMCITMGVPGQPLRVDDAGNVDNGRPLPGLEVRIIDESGKVAAPGEIGEITMQGPTIFAGYLDDPQATAEVVRDGWLYTGDMGYLDEDGYLFVLGRLKSLIKRGGSVISPREVETAADQVPGVRFSVAVGVPRKAAIHSEDLVVLAEVKPEAVTSEEGGRALAEAIANTVHAQVGHAPSDVVLLKPRSVPRTPNGKIQHGVLRDLYASGQIDGMLI